MKSYITIFILSFFISCSSDSADSVSIPDPTPISKPVTPAPVVKYTLSVTAGEGGTVSTTGGEYESGQTVSVTATPQGEYLFKDWSDGNTNATRTITVSSNINLTANFEKRKYPLTINIEGEGEVIEEIVNAGRTTDYDSGATVKLTAVPSEGWEFVAWTGAIESTELEVQLLVSEAKEVNAEFKKILYSVSTNQIIIPNSSQFNNYNIYQSIVNITAKIYYSNSFGEYFIFGPSTSSDYSNVDSRSDAPPAYPIVLKKLNDEWVLDEIYTDAPIWLARNFKIKENVLVLGDGNELGKYGAAWESENLEDKFKWRGNAYIADLSSNKISWKKVNDDENMTWFHGITIGDINGDSHLDVGGVPAPGIKLFLNNETNGFTSNDELINYDENLNIPFTIEFEDLDNDKLDEIIFASYGDENNPVSEHNSIQIYKHNQTTNRYERVFFKKFGVGSQGEVLGATSIKVYDFNNDGIKDISICREARNNDSFEIWIGKSDIEYEPYFFQNLNQYNINIKEFNVMDVNLDGYLDIVLNIFMGSGFNTSNGLDFNKAIWINDGKGGFSMYNEKNLTVDVLMNSYTSYMKNGVLNIIAPHLTLEEINNSDDISFRFKHIKFHLN